MPTIRILVDDRVAEMRPKGLQAEHGFAVAVDDDVLLDTGQSGIAAANADRMGVRTEYETVVLSHGHYDHTGGLPAFLDGAETLFTHPAALETKVSDEGEYIGIPYRRARLEADVDVVTHREPVEVQPGVYALGEIPRTFPDNPTGEILDADGSRRADPLWDDQSVAVETEHGTVLICGCCHAGLRNTISHAEAVTDDTVRAVIGGTHLGGREADEIHEIADWLDDRLDLLAPTHCSGVVAERILATRFPEIFTDVGVGSVIDW